MTSLAVYFTALDELLRRAPLRIDRPRGSADPLFPEVIYPVDFGFLEDVAGADTEGVDVFRGSAEGAGIVGVALTVDLTRREAKVKILLDCADDEIDTIERFLHERLRLNAAMVRRP